MSGFVHGHENEQFEVDIDPADGQAEFEREAFAAVVAGARAAQQDIDDAGMGRPDGVLGPTPIQEAQAVFTARIQSATWLQAEELVRRFAEPITDGGVQYMLGQIADAMHVKSVLLDNVGLG